MTLIDSYEATGLKGQAIVIIALTTNALDHERPIIPSVGCDDFVRKPFREEIIFDLGA